MPVEVIVVLSQIPKPLEIVELDTIKTGEQDTIVITVGGGYSGLWK